MSMWLVIWSQYNCVHWMCSMNRDQESCIQNTEICKLLLHQSFLYNTRIEGFSASTAFHTHQYRRVTHHWIDDLVWLRKKRIYWCWLTRRFLLTSFCLCLENIHIVVCRHLFICVAYTRIETLKRCNAVHLLLHSIVCGWTQYEWICTLDRWVLM